METIERAPERVQSESESASSAALIGSAPAAWSAAVLCGAEMSRRERTALGYHLIPSERVRDITRTAERTALAWSGADSGECTARVLDAVAAYVVKRPEQGAEILASEHRTRALSRRVARRVLSRLGTGRGMLDASTLEGYGIDASTLERVERTPHYSPWLDEEGAPLPSAGASVHPIGVESAPGIPERDAEGLWRGNLEYWASALPSAERATLDAAAAAVYRTRSGDTIRWSESTKTRLGVLSILAPEYHAHRSTLLRRVRSALERIERERERCGGAVPPSECEYPQSAPVTRHECGSGCDHGRSILWSAPECEHGEGCGCPARTRHESAPLPSAPLAPLGCNLHAAGECPAECPARVRRRERIERVQAAAAAVLPSTRPALPMST